MLCYPTGICHSMQLFADDFGCFLEAEENNIRQALEVIEGYCKDSGAKVN